MQNQDPPEFAEPGKDIPTIEELEQVIAYSEIDFSNPEMGALFRRILAHYYPDYTPLTQPPTF